MISGTKMTTFDFLVLIIENLGIKNPYKHVLGHFGRGRDFRHFSAEIERGVGIIGITQNFGKEFFVGAVTFRKMQIFKKKFCRPEFDPLSRCEIEFVIIGCVTSEI